MSRIAVKVEHIPVLGTEARISYTGMDAKLRALPLTWNSIKLDDRWFFAPGWDDWRKIIEFLRPKVPKYLSEKFDCDNIADWARVHAAEYFKINSMARVDGMCRVEVAGNPGPKYVRHAWNLFYDSAGGVIYQLEMQTGVIMDLDDPEYVPDEIIMG